MLRLRLHPVAANGAAYAQLRRLDVRPAATRASWRTVPWLALLPLLGLPLAGSIANGYEIVILTTAVLLIVAGTANPVWALCGLMLSELTLRNSFLPAGGAEISNRLFLSLFAAAVILPSLPVRRPLLPGTGMLAFWLMGFFLLAVAANLGTSGIGSTFQLSRYLATGLLLAALMSLLLRDRESLLTFVAFCGMLAVASALAGVLQHWSGAGTFSLVESSFGGRSIGLTESPILLSNDLLLFAFFPLAVIFRSGIDARTRRLCLIAAACLIAGLFFSGTRSWLVAFVPAALALGLMLERRHRRRYFLVLVIGLVTGALLLISSGSRYTLSLSQESSAASRPVLWSTSYLIITDHPLLGIGRDRYKDYSLDYAPKLPASLRDEVYVSRALGRFSPHQDFLNVWVSFGAGAFIFYCGVFVVVTGAFIRAYRLHAGDPLLQAVSAGGLAALVAYALNSSFHNLLEVTWSFWFLSGLAAALLGLAALRKERPAW